MSTTLPPTGRPSVVYPDSDGKRMADNTVQYEWIVTLKGNLDLLFRDRADVFVAGDHLIYPVEGNNKLRQAPDVYVAFGRPKGHRGSYRVWDEGGVFPQVVIEVRSPGNRAAEMARKLLFYNRYGAEEYLDFDPQRTPHRLRVYRRSAGGLAEVPAPGGYVSQRLGGVRFDLTEPELVVYDPAGRRFLTFLEVGERADQADREQRRADREHRRANRQQQRADQEQQRADQEQQRAEKLAARLRELGVDPDAV